MLLIFGIKGANWSSKKCKRGVLSFRDKLENSPSKPRELGYFSLFSPIFPPVPPKNWAFPPSYILLLRIGIEKGYPLKKFGHEKLKITVSISIFIKAVFNYAFCKKS